MKLKKWAVLCLAGMMTIFMLACEKEAEDKNVSSEVEQGIIEDDKTSGEELQVNDSEKSEEAAKDSDTKETEHSNMIHLMVGMVYEHEYSDTYSQSIAHAEYPVVKLEDCCEEEHEALEDAIDDLNEDERASVRNQYWEYIDWAKEELSSGNEYFAMYELSEDVTVRRADTTVVSLLYDGYSFSGGVHGMNYYWSKNIDTQTGEILMLSDVLNDVDRLPQIVRKEVEEHIPEEELFGYDGIEDAVISAGEGLTWVLDYNGMTVYFDPYEIGPFASGAHMVTLSYEEYPDLVKDNFKQVPDNYTMSFSEYETCRYDVDYDGMLDEIKVWGQYDEYDTITTMIISINGSQYKYETWCYSINPMLIHMADGNNYLYVQTSSDNDYRTIDIYKLGTDQVESMGYITCGFYTEIADDEEYWGLEQVITDPYQFRLDTRTDLLSTSSAYKNYIINSNGVPASKDPYYYISYPLRLTSKKPLPVELVDKDTMESVGFTTIERGDVVTYHGTDDKNIGYLKLSDGSIAKILVNVDEWPNTVNGFAIEDQFDGVMWAG